MTSHIQLWEVVDLITVEPFRIGNNLFCHFLFYLEHKIKNNTLF